MIAIDYNGLSLLIFEEKCTNYAAGKKSAPAVLTFSQDNEHSELTKVEEQNRQNLDKADKKQELHSVISKTNSKTIGFAIFSDKTHIDHGGYVNKQN